MHPVKFIIFGAHITINHVIHRLTPWLNIQCKQHSTSEGEPSHSAMYQGDCQSLQLTQCPDTSTQHLYIVQWGNNTLLI